MCINRPHRNSPRRTRIVAGLLAILFATAVYLAATPGLPFLEDFSDTTLRDAPRTFADWSTTEQAVLLPQREKRFGAFSPTHLVITDDASFTVTTAVGDVDGDGDLDVVAGNRGEPNQLYLNNGTSDPWNGVIGIVIDAVAAQTNSLALGDVDGDGDLDLVTGNGYDSDQSNRLYLNNGTPDPWNGVPGVDITADNDRTYSIALGDVDGDGDLDLVCGNWLGQINRLYLHNGTADPWNGTAGIDITPDAMNTTAVALEDVDGDGDLDLVAAHYGAANRLYLNNGSADPWNGVTGTNITADTDLTFDVALGDVDGDGDLDLVCGNWFGQINRLYLNNGTADPWNGVTGVDITTDAVWTGVVTLGDVDGDGDLDLATANNFSPVYLYLNNGTADPWGGVSSIDVTSNINANHSVQLADMDGDGDLDLVVAKQGAGVSAPNRLYINQTIPSPLDSTTPIDITADLEWSTSAALGDVDGDGDLDLVVGNEDVPNRLYLNNGTADPWNGVTGVDITTDSLNTQAVALGDVDGDGDPDLVAGNGSFLIPGGEINRLYLNNGTSDPWNGVSGIDITSDSDRTESVALGDVDGDGDLDLVAGNSSYNRLYLNNGTSNPWNGVSGINITGDLDVTFAVVLGDVDSDGDLDLMAGNGNGNWINRLYLNNGTGNPWNGVSGVNITADANDTRSAALGDVDGDGDLDLVAGNLLANRLYLNNGTADPWNGVSAVVIDPTDTAPTLSVALGDVDGDGHIDLAAGNVGWSHLYLNNGTPDPWNGVLGANTDGTETHVIVLGDVDGDGDLDQVTANGSSFGGITNRLFLNNGTSDPWIVNGSDITLDSDATRTVVLGDVDADGDLDLVIGNIGQTNEVHLNNGTADPWNGVSGIGITADAGATTSAALGDVDGDGDLDLVVGNSNQTNRLYLNNGTSDPWNGVAGSDITADANRTESIALGDVDGDGDLDMVAGDYFLPNRLYLNNGTADPWNGVSGIDITADASFTRKVALGDVDGDGDLDLVDGNDSGNQIRVYLNNGTTDPWNGVSGVNVTSDAISEFDIALGDVDRDGDLDLVTANRFGANRLYLNDGVGDPWDTLVAGVDITADADDTNRIALHDLDGDGDLDLVAGNNNQPNRLYLNDGAGDPWDTLTTGSDITADATATWGLAMADVNRDGITDLVAANLSSRNRYYRYPVTPGLYDTALGGAVSLRVDNEIDAITNATLTATATLPANTAIDYWLSNDGGARWHLVRPGVPFAFPQAGLDLRWKAELHSLSPVETPRLDEVNITTQVQPISIGDTVWEDLDGDGIQDPGEPGLDSVVVTLHDSGGAILDLAVSGPSGDYAFNSVTWGAGYSLQYYPPPGYALAPQNAGMDDAADSDVDAVTGMSPPFTLGGFDSHTRWDAGMVPANVCVPPDEPIYLSMMTLSTDGNDYPVLHFMDANQPTQITGYNIYRTSDPGLLTDPASLFATDIIDMDAATPNLQWVDISGDVAPGGIWYYGISAWNNRCPAQTAEGPF